jgi:hypothetical protein
MRVSFSHTSLLSSVRYKRNSHTIALVGKKGGILLLLELIARNLHRTMIFCVLPSNREQLLKVSKFWFQGTLWLLTQYDLIDGSVFPIALPYLWPWSEPYHGFVQKRWSVLLSKCYCLIEGASWNYLISLFFSFTHHHIFKFWGLNSVSCAC